MSDQKQPDKPLPIDDGVIVKMPEINIGGTVFPSYNSTKQFLDKAKESIYKTVPRGLYLSGIGAEILEPGKKWVSGKVRLSLVLEFIPDEPENNEILNKFVSPLDDIRNMSV